ncbi:MAG TPA: hypothetical protein VLM18_02750 [Croceibacterium sp.]|nr:hypothetical protein [Croceibacterium sp.]
MAIVRGFEPRELDRSSTHSEGEATIFTVEADGERFIQIDTYGSADRAMPGKVSQRLRLSKDAFDQLMKVGSKHF